MKKSIKIILISISPIILIMILGNKILAETINNANTNQSVDSTQETDLNDIQNIGKKYNGKDYIVGDVRNDNIIDVSDAVDVLTIISKILSWDYNNNKVQDDYEIYQKIVEKGTISNNENIKSVEDLYNICDVDKDDEISVKDARKILVYYARKAAGNLDN